MNKKKQNKNLTKNKTKQKTDGSARANPCPTKQKLTKKKTKINKQTKTKQKLTKKQMATQEQTPAQESYGGFW